jgi:hypothetical protein
MKKSFLIFCSVALLLIGAIGLLWNQASGVNLTVTQAEAPALTFDGSDDSVVFSTYPFSGTQLTVSFWFNSPLGTLQRIWVQDNTANEFQIYFNFLGASLHITTSTGKDLALSIGNLTGCQNRWCHLVTTIDTTLASNNCLSYLNGSPLATTSLINAKNGSFTQTGFWLSYNKIITGSIVDLRLFNRALSAAEITQIYQGQNIISGLVAQYPLSSGGGQVVYDTSGNGYHGAMQNFTLSTAWAGRQNRYLYGLHNGQSLYQNSSSLDVNVPYWFRASDSTFQPYTSTAYLPVGYTKISDTAGRGFPKTNVVISGIPTPTTILKINNP